MYQWCYNIHVHDVRNFFIISIKFYIKLKTQLGVLLFLQLLLCCQPHPHIHYFQRTKLFQTKFIHFFLEMMISHNEWNISTNSKFQITMIWYDFSSFFHSKYLYSDNIDHYYMYALKSTNFLPFYKKSFYNLSRVAFPPTMQPGQGMIEGQKCQ